MPYTLYKILICFVRWTLAIKVSPHFNCIADVDQLQSEDSTCHICLFDKSLLDKATLLSGSLSLSVWFSMVPTPGKCFHIDLASSPGPKVTGA